MLLAQRCLHKVEQGAVFGFLVAKGLGNRGNNQGGIAQGSQGDETDAIGEVIAQFGSDAERHPGFANATCARERHQARLWPSQERTGRCHFPFAPNE
jgi:hypothetical protein